MRIDLAADHDAMGGSEMMMLLAAQACMELGHDATVWVPTETGEVAREADRRGLTVRGVEAHGNASYMRRLRAGTARSDADVLWCHGLRPSVATAGLPRRIAHVYQRPRPLQRPALKRALRGAGAVVVPSHSMADIAPKTHVLWNWCEPVDAPQTIHEGTLSVGYLGRLSMEKGLGVLTEALAELPGTELVLAGTPRFVIPSERRSIEHALERVADRTDRLGWVTASELFDRIDVLAVPPVWQEPFGQSVIEAMSAGVPLIVSDAGALGEVTGDDYPLCVAAGDARSLAAAIQAVAALTPEQLQGLTRRLHHRWEKHFSPDAGRRRVEVLLDRLT